METALVIGASGGIGAALVRTLESRGTRVTALSRSEDGLDMADEGAVNRVLGRQEGTFGLIVVACGILAPEGLWPEKALGQISGSAMAQVFAVNAIGPALVLRHAPRLLPRKGRSVLAVLTARVGSIGDNRLGGWYSYRASKAAANQIVRTAAIEMGRSHRDAAIVALHPGTVDTPFTADYPAHRKVGPDEAAGNLLDVIDGIGPDQSGQFFDWAGQEVPW